MGGQWSIGQSTCHSNVDSTLFCKRTLGGVWPNASYIIRRDQTKLGGI